MKALLVVVIVLVALLGGLGYELKTVQAERNQYRTQVQSIAAENRGLVRAASVARSAQKLSNVQLQEAQRDLAKALEQNPDWADQRVPDDVARAIGVQYPDAEGKPATGHPDVSGSHP